MKKEYPEQSAQVGRRKKILPKLTKAEDEDLTEIRHHWLKEAEVSGNLLRALERGQKSPSSGSRASSRPGTQPL